MSVLKDAHDNLRSELNSLKTQWIATRQAWRDQVGDRFETEFWKPIEDDSTKYLNTLIELTEAMQQADIHTR